MPPAPKYPSQPPPMSDGKNPHVMIVGAGIAGLFLAILLDKAGIPYEIYERAQEVKPLGSIMALHHSVMPVLDQLGLLEEVKAISLPSRAMDSKIMYDDLTIIAEIPRFYERLDLGYDALLFDRPAFYNLLLSKVQAEKIHLGKKVLSMTQSKEGAMIRCADGTTYHGDVLVGADGAYSGVRQSLYKFMKEHQILPVMDSKDLNKGYIALVGTTGPLDPEKFPVVAREDSSFSQVIGRGTSYNWSLFNVANRKICWVVVQQLASLEETELVRFRNSEWGPESAKEMIEVVKDFRVPTGGTLGNLINLTPKDGISRVFLEDKLFETWNRGRTVLIGDAAHKLLPSAGQGAVCAMLDAVVLANCLYDMKTPSLEYIQEALQEYKAQRYPYVKEQYKASKMNAIILYGQTLKERFIRHMALNWVPQAVVDKTTVKGTRYRPQATFLPFVPKRGKGEGFPQTLSPRFLAEQRQKQKKESLAGDTPTTGSTVAL